MRLYLIERKSYHADAARLSAPERRELKTVWAEANARILGNEALSSLLGSVGGRIAKRTIAQGGVSVDVPDEKRARFEKGLEEIRPVVILVDPPPPRQPK